MRTAYFAGGCFWCIASPFYNQKGVKDVISGYCGGDEINPTYEEVKHQLTKHRETIAIEYDETLVSFEQLFDIYVSHIDPFDAGGQYIDRGHSYTLACYYQNEEELSIASTKLSALEKREGKKPCIALEKLKVFYTAEEYHQHYSEKNPEAFEKELIESGRKK